MHYQNLVINVSYDDVTASWVLSIMR